MAHLIKYFSVYLCVSLLACSDPPLETDETETPMSPSVGMRVDAAIVDMPNQNPGLDAGMTGMMPDLPP